MSQSDDTRFLKLMKSSVRLWTENKVAVLMALTLRLVSTVQIKR